MNRIASLARRASRGRPRIAILSMSLCLFSGGCGKEQLEEALGTSKPRLFVVLVDVSGSTPSADWALYKQVYTEAVTGLHTGDRLVLARIGDASLTRFSALGDRTLFSGQVSLDDADSAKVAKADLTQAFEMLLDVKAGRTKILDGLEAAMQVVGSDPGRRPSIVLLSDMLEDSEVANFERAPVTEAITARLLSSRQLKMPAVDVFVVGASANDQQRYREVQQFWTKFLTTAGARVAIYGRTAPRFPD